MQKIFTILGLAILAGCASFEPLRTQRFVDETGSFVQVEYGMEKEPKVSNFTLSNGVVLPFKSKLKVRVEMPDGKRFVAFQRMSESGNLYIDDVEEWEFYERGTGCMVARKAKGGGGFDLLYQGTLCATVRDPFAEKRESIRSGGATPRDFGRESSGPRTVDANLKK